MIKLGKGFLTGHRRFKVLLVGSKGCGKSSFIKRCIQEDFSTEYLPTLGSELYLIDAESEAVSEKVTMQTWDCGGAERFRPIVQQQYQGTKGIVLMYDMTSEESFKELLYWHNEMLRVCPDAAMVVVGTKCDLSDKVKLNAEDGKKQCKEWNVPHAVVSARSQQGVDAVFPTLLTAMVRPGG